MIYDCFTFFNELDILDIRLHEMSPVVDKFVLVEAKKTFQGDSKPLYFSENKRRYAKFSDKIIHVVIDFPDDIEKVTPYRHTASITWAREFYQRDQISQGLVAAQPGDLIIISDVDEIIAAHRLKEAIRIRRRYDLTAFTMPLYVHFINRRARGTPWLFGPRMIEFEHFTSGQRLRMTRFRQDRKVSGPLLKRIYMRARNIPRYIRTRIINYRNAGIGNPILEIPDSGWHMTSIGNWDNYRQKINSYSHEEYKDGARFNEEPAFFNWILQNTEEVPLRELPGLINANPDLHTKLAWLGADQ